MLWKVKRRCRPTTLMPVSYTHLDVYKRQGQDGLHGGKTHSEEQQRVKLLPEKPGEGKPENLHSADHLRRMDSQNTDNRDCRGDRQGKEQEQQGASQEKGGNVNGQNAAGEVGKPYGEQKPQPQADQQDSRQFADHSADVYKRQPRHRIWG